MKNKKSTLNKTLIMTKMYRLMPLLLLFFIGLVKTTTLSYHQKVFKTSLILISCMILILFVFLSGKKRSELTLLHIFFGIFLFLYFFQYAGTFFSGEISYDREYYIANYIFLLVFSFFTSMFFSEESDLLWGMKLIAVCMVVFFCISMHDFIQYVSYPKSITPTLYRTVCGNVSTDDIAQLDYFYKGNSKNYKLNVSLNKENKTILKHLLKKGKYYTSVNYKSLITFFRPALSFGNTNYFAAYLIGLLPLGILSFFCLFDRRKSIKENKTAVIYGTMALLGFIPLLFTQTTSAFFGLFVTGVFLIIPTIVCASSFSRKTKIILLSAEAFIFLILPVILWLLLPDLIGTLFPRVIKKLSAPEFAVRDRLNGWTPALHLFVRHPITGAGLGTIYPASFKYMSKYFYIYSDSNSFKHAHNEFVELLGEGGVIALLLFLFLCFFIVVNMIRIYFKKDLSKIMRYCALGIAAGICSMLGQQCFDLSLRMSVTMAAFFWLIGAGFFLTLKCPADNGKLSILWQKKITIPNFIIAAAALLLVLIGWRLAAPLFSAEYNLIQALRSKDQKEMLLQKAHKAMPRNPYVLNNSFSYHLSMMQMGINQFENLLQENNDEKISYIKVFVQNMYQKAYSDISLLSQSIPGYQDIWSKRCSLNIQYLRFLAVHYDFDPNDEYISSITSLKKEVLDDLECSLNQNFLNVSNHISRIYLTAELKSSDDVCSAVKEYLEAKLLIDYAKKKRLLQENIRISFTDEDAAETKHIGNDWYFSIPEKIVTETGNSIYNGNNVSDELEKLYKLITTTQGE
ncbi:MAG: O-antigen ligase family protein [Spirochaetales bacterium]|nr:O-antigen ligase family protein [Spirochaetales bacterium]